MIKKQIQEDKRNFVILILYVILLLFFCSKMSPLYPINEWADVNLYFNIGKAIFHGQVPYVDVFDHKGPLIFFIYGIGYLLSNTSFLGIYFIQCLLWILMVSAAYLTAKLYLDKIYALFAAMLLPALMLSHTLNGGSADEFITVFEVISLYLFILYFKDRSAAAHKPAHMLIHGLLCAMTLFIKINLIAFWVFPLLFIFINIIQQKKYRNLLENAIALLLGLSIIALPILLYFIFNNALQDAWDTYIVLNKSYSKPGSIGEILERLFSYLYQQIRYGNFEFIIILIGAIWFPLKYIENRLGKVAIILSFAATYTAIFISSYYIDYYSVPLYAFILLGCIVICRYIKVPSPSWKYYALFIILALYMGIQQRKFFGMDFSELSGKKENSFDISKFSQIVEQEKNPTLMNLGLDLGNSVFTKADVIPNVKYFISPNLEYDMYPVMRDEQTKYIEQRKVQFIILAEIALNFSYFSQLPALRENYEVVSVIGNEGGRYYLYKLKQ